MPSTVSASAIEALPMPIWPAEIYPLEPVQGWFQRAAKRNYALSADAFVDSLGLSGRDWDYDEMLKVVHQLPIDGLDALEASTPKRCDNIYEICGHKLSLRFITKSSRRVCPMCLDERRYVRTWFDVVPVASCPHHDVALIDGLPSDPLDWRHPEIGWTKSGTKIGAEHAKMQIASELDHYIVRSFIADDVGLPDHLKDLSLNTVLTASVCVGKLFRGDEKHTPTHENVRSLCQIGFDSLVGGGDTITDFLSGAAWLQRDSDKGRYKVRCNDVPNMLQAIEDDGLRSLITDAFARARVRNGLATPSGRLSKYDGEDDRRNLKSAARSLDVTSHTLGVLIRKLGIDSYRCQYTRAFRLSREQIHLVQNYINNSLCPDDVSRLLGCTTYDVHSLVKRRLLNMDFQMRGVFRYNQSDINHFSTLLLSYDADRCVNGSQPLREFLMSRGVPLAEACSRILRDKSLLVVEHDPLLPLFAGLKVAEAEVVA
ncbi:TniQ family protein [Erythrobacter sp. W302b]|uniref:TniQ family protein n=1 Tax=Erythrobacter sp. W302b TaxID=3389874 RepID=UPI00396B411E